MKKTYLIAAFIVTVLLQLSIPLKMIYDSEITEKKGAEFKFRTVPIDPTDYLRGKYITLDYAIAAYPTNDTTFKNEEQIYIMLKKDAEGFAQIASVLHDEPDNETNYVIANVNHSYSGTLHIEFPFNRYYMAENKAAEAESAYNIYSRKEKAKPAYAIVAVRKGNGVVKDVMIDNMPIKEYVVLQRKKK